MDLIVKKASALSAEEKAALGITGIPENWPIEVRAYIDTIPVGFERMTTEDLELLKFSNQAAYDAWANALRPIEIRSPIQQVQLASPSSLDNKPVIQASPRPIGTYTYLSGKGDDPDDSSKVEGGVKLIWRHKIGDNASKAIYYDINTITNETHLHGASLQWKNADGDEAECEICCKSSEAAIGSGSNTFYEVVSGILVMAAGNGTKTVTDWDLINPVQMVPNEFGNIPKGYWDCTYNTSTKKFENYVFKADGSGAYNIFAQEVELNCFVPAYIMIGNGLDTIKSSDVSQIGHNMRIKVILTTDIITDEVEDHAWTFCANVYLFRKRTY